MPLAHNVGRGFGRRDPKDREDYIACANLGLVQAVQWICEGRCPHDNVKGYVIETCRAFCTNYVRSKTGRAERPFSVAEHDGRYWDHSSADSRIVCADILGYFTLREQEVIRWKMSGETQKEIAERLCLSAVRVGQILDQIRAKYEDLIL